jgi:hypothetical protein
MNKNIIAVRQKIKGEIMKDYIFKGEIESKNM